MHVYTHLIMAAFAEGHLRPAERGAYYLGAVAPDARYVAGLRRSLTHRPASELDAAFENHPVLRSFLLGYRLHCALDDTGADRLAAGTFPMRWLAALLPRQFLPALIEMYYLRHPRPLPRLSETGNDFTRALGLADAPLQQYARRINALIEHPSLEGELQAFASAGLLDDPRVARYMNYQRWLNHQPWLMNVLFGWGKLDVLHEHALAQAYAWT